MRLPSPFQILDELRARPIDASEAIANLEIAAMAGSTWARERLAEIAAEQENSFLIRQAAGRAVKKLRVVLGPLKDR